MLHTEFQDHTPFGSREEDFLGFKVLKDRIRLSGLNNHYPVGGRKFNTHFSLIISVTCIVFKFTRPSYLGLHTCTGIKYFDKEGMFCS